MANKHRRDYLKVHLAVDLETLEILAFKVTKRNVHDGTVLHELLAEVSKIHSIRSVRANATYDGLNCRRSIVVDHDAKALVATRKDAVMRKEDCPAVQARNETVRIMNSEGEEVWKELSGYNLRSLVETLMSRLKRLGEKLASRKFENQVVEVAILCLILNTHTAIGLPKRARKRTA